MGDQDTYKAKPGEKLEPIIYAEETTENHPHYKGAEDYMFYCPGCRSLHIIRVKGQEPRWIWNGSLTAPTFEPSYLCGAHDPDTGEKFKLMRCHSYIKEGKIQFLNDCYHDLAGRTVELPGMDKHSVKRRNASNDVS